MLNKYVIEIPHNFKIAYDFFAWFKKKLNHCFKSINPCIRVVLIWKVEKLYWNRDKFVRFRWRTIYAKYLREKSMFTGWTWAVKLHGSFHPNSTRASIGTISDFAQNCTKCDFVGAMKKYQTSVQNSKWFRFYGFLKCKGHNPFLPS